MADVELHIEDPILRETTRLLLERAGHRVTDRNGTVLLAQSPARARNLMDRGRPLLMFAGVADVAEAVTLMRQGAYGYILLPLQPGELELMVSRAAASISSTQPATREPVQPGPQPSETDGKSIPSLDYLEREAILSALNACGGNRTQAARMLGIGRNTLWRKTRAYGLNLPSGRKRPAGGGGLTTDS